MVSLVKRLLPEKRFLMKKFLLAATIFVMAFVFDGCSQNPAQDKNQEIDELNSIIESQNEEINDLSEENEGLSAEISQLLTQIEEYEIQAYDEPLAGE